MRMSNCNFCLLVLLIANIVICIVTFQITQLNSTKIQEIQFNESENTTVNDQTDRNSQNTAKFADDTQSTEQKSHTNFTTPDIYVITPTYEHWAELAELTRVLQAFRLSSVKIMWLLIEDRENGNSQKISNFRQEVQTTAENIHVVLLNAKTPNGTKHRGVMQRNTALDYLGSLETLEMNVSAPVYSVMKIGLSSVFLDILIFIGGHQVRLDNFDLFLPERPQVYCLLKTSLCLFYQCPTFSCISPMTTTRTIHYFYKN